MKNLKIQFSLFFTFLLIAFAAPVFAQNGQINESFQKVRKIKLDLAVGNIEFQKSTSQETKLEAKYDDKKLDVEVVYNSGKLTIVEKTRKRNNNNLEGSNYTLQIPDNVLIDINTGTGSIRLDGIIAETKMNTGTGHIIFKNYEGYSKLNTGTGDVKVTDSEGEIDMNSGTGDVVINNSGGELNANSGTGDVEVENIRGRLSVNSGTGDVHGRDVALEEEASFNSGIGNAKYVLSGSLKEDLNINSGTGNAILDMNGQNFNGTLIMSCDKDHGNISAPFSFDKEEIDDDNDTLIKYKYFGDSGVELKVSTGTGRAKVIK